MTDGDATGAGGELDSVTIAACVAAVVLGGLVWGVTMASAPRYSQGPNSDMGNATALAVGLGALAVLLGALVPRRAALVGGLVTVGALVLAPWTAPRGDGDGLWIMILPMLGMGVIGTSLVAQVGASVRKSFTRRAGNSDRNSR